jgi:hypothetical protein
MLLEREGLGRWRDLLSMQPMLSMLSWADSRDSTSETWESSPGPPFLGHCFNLVVGEPLVYNGGAHRKAVFCHSFIIGGLEQFVVGVHFLI